MSDRVYWRIAKKSPVMKVITEALAIQNVFQKAMKTLKEEFKASGIMAIDNAAFSGLLFDEAPIPGMWRKVKGKFVADYRTKAGRELRTRLESLPQGVDARRFSNMLGRALKLDFEYFADHCVMWTVYEHHGDAYVLSVPLGLGIKAIPGCKELKMSEYWKLREAK